ncbi:hypothetical protein BX616_000620 [Lobosporangium transversale]|uniref:PX domain-containing protein n=1 Tax=Lobosporangium transversale TaxID=64571 RepID=A0A1Y2GRJ9_9FUNG|nr:hypothetical protein BCR41DRAFT_352243 [Lobosporangium transversale]KAF9906801.1 hypothetical protein BX616_000620 [Lobosporangium transversale]ORZ18363.1 hypothetical protein BCR41DRAFT_352243 [Lobosporangium transversale]|eukprot:XP_021882158.1 hypothetical protein BCR41DRAFT_352243 [Lobosporangium transversale]
MSDTSSQNQALLSSLQEHYLKKYLLGVLINNEINRLQKKPYETLPDLGGPFDLKDEHYATSTTPFLRYLFESIVVPFPFLSSSSSSKGTTLWPKIQRFMEEWAKIEAGNGVEREEMIRRKRLKNKGERTLVLMYSMAIKTIEQRAKEKKDILERQERMETAKRKKQEEQQQQQQNISDFAFDSCNSNRDNKHQRDLQDGSLDSLRSQSQSQSRSPSPSAFSTMIHGVRINVIGVRLVKEKRRVREHEHVEFIISTTFADGKEAVVARRYGRFRRLYRTLRHDFPHEELPVPPAKYEAKSRVSRMEMTREKDRISLRGYLRNLAKVSQEIADSKTFVDFLTQDAIDLTEEEAKDIQTRVALDEHRMAQQSKFDREVAKKVDELDAQLKEIKLDLLQPGGVSRLFSAFKHFDNVNDLPPLYQTVFEWGCMNFASTLYHVFTSSDDATLNFTQLKRTHMLLPYRTMWGILKVSNPMAMMKGIMDLFLAQPFGTRSLMQRIISGNIQEEVSEYKKEIDDLETAIGDPALCEKIRSYVYAPRSVISQIFPDDEPYDITELSLVMDVLRSDQIQPVLEPMQIKRVWDAQQKLEHDRLEKERLKRERHQSKFENDRTSDYASESDSHSSGSSRSSMEEMMQNSSRNVGSNANQGKGVEEPEQNLVQQLQQLLVAHLRIRDKERLMSLVFQGVTGEILKEAIAIFYEPLVKVYKAANVADSLMDVKNFADELIKTVEQAELNDNNNQKSGSAAGPTAATLYLNLVRKHLPTFYKFVHAVHKQDDGIFHDLLGWIESVITFMRTGYGHVRIDYKTGEELHVGINLDAFVKENVSAAQWDQVQKEAQELTAYFTEVKDRKREQVRRMAGLDRASQSQRGGGYTSSSGNSSATATPRLSMDEGYNDAAERERERITKELTGMGMQQEDVDEFQMINWDNHYHHPHHGQDDNIEDDDVEGEMGLKIPKVPTIDTLLTPFVQLMDKVLFQTARE